MSTVFELRVNASNLPKYRLIRTPNCYARITIDGEHTFITKAIRGSGPEWSECFDVLLQESSTIAVQLFHVLSPSKEIPWGAALIPVRDWLSGSQETILCEHKLHEAGMKYRSGAIVRVTLHGKSSGQPSAASEAILRQVIPASTSVRQPQALSEPSNALDNTVTSTVHSEIERAEAIVSGLKGRNGKPRHNVAVLSSSELYTSVLGYIKKVVQLGDVLSQVHPYAEVAWNVLTVAYKAVEGQIDRDHKIRTLLLTIHDMLEFVDGVDTISKISEMQDTVSAMMEEIRECALFIQEYGRKGIGVRIIRDNLSTVTDDRIEQFIMEFNRLKWKFDQGINIQTFNTVRQLAPVLKDAETGKLLERLPGWDLEGVKFNESKTCLERTRQQLLDDIHRWADSTDEPHIFWLSGGAGTGKTSVANSIAVSFDKLGRLGACFCFSRDTAGLNTPNHLFGNLCYQLAHFEERGEFPVRSFVLSTIRSMGYITSYSLHTQARRLIVDTTNAAKLDGPVLVVIDALDESGNTQMRKQLLDAIATELPKLPQVIKVMITSRDEPDIRTSLQDFAKEVYIDDFEKTGEDIASYVDYRLTAIRRHARLSQHWPGDDKSQELVRRAGHLFIWASVACNFVEEKRDPALRLDRLLDATSGTEAMNETPLTSLDILYSGILRNAFPEEGDPLVDFRYVVGSLIILESPLSQFGLDSLLGLGYESGGPSILQNGHEIQLSSSDVIISPLRSILREDRDPADSKGNDGLLRLLHPSLYDFLTSRVDGHFRIDPTQQNRILAIRCLSVMNSQLTFDICMIGDPSLLNKEVQDLPERISRNISEGLRYSCRSIGYHLLKVLDPDATLTNGLKQFVSGHLLHWIEVMSLLGEVSKAERTLHTLAGWTKDNANDDTKLQVLIRDAISFLRNCGLAIRLCALHTYYSALALTPRTTDLFHCFSPKFPQIPSVISSHPVWDATTVRVLEDHAASVNHVIFSPDGKTLASASYDKTVRLWNVQTGQAIRGALEGHTDGISHVVFSPNGKKLASASDDMTVQLWDVDSGKAIGGALKGHTLGIPCAVFSPDGKKLASASYDKTVWIWDVDQGQDSGQVLVGHTDKVQHVIFSPDGRMLVSASDDGTVRLWNVENAQAIGEALRGHTHRVRHVVFSPDGKMLASASYDKTVLLWDAKSGKTIGEALEGHTDRVNHVIFSPAGNILASASDDRTVRVWNVKNGQSVGGALEGHSHRVNNVAFSPDGKKLASASHDKTIQLWNVDSGEAVGALNGHILAVLCVVFSPDGKKLASSSYDKTVRIWDIEGSQSMGEAFDGHADRVRNIVFSPDRRKLASASDDETVRLWDADSGKAIGAALKGHTRGVRHVVFSPNGEKLALVSYDKMVWLWDIESSWTSGKVLEDHTDWVRSVTFSLDGKKLASASDDKTVRLWDAESGQAIGDALEGHSDWVLHVTFSPDGTLLASASYDTTVRLWAVERGQTLAAVFEGHINPVLHLCFAPDGKTLASASGDETVRLWDVEGGLGIGEALQGHTGPVLYAVFSPDGKALASAAGDKTVRLWDVASCQCMGEVFEPYSPTNIYPGGRNLQILDMRSDQWISDVFMNSTDYDSLAMAKQLPYSGEFKMVQAAMSFDELGFLRHGTMRLLWLPVMLRGYIAAQTSLVAVGGGSGAVTIIKFRSGLHIRHSR